MVLTQIKRHSPRDPNKFPAAQLFLLGEFPRDAHVRAISAIDRSHANMSLALVRVAEPIALTSILPYAWKLVLRFHVGDKSNASFYAGLLISAFALAESITGMYVEC